MSLTKQDLTKIENIVDKKIKANNVHLEKKIKASADDMVGRMRTYIHQNFATKQGIRDVVKEEMHDVVGHLPTKEEFYTMMDQIMGELKGIREDMAAAQARADRHEQRITVLESYHTDVV